MNVNDDGPGPSVERWKTSTGWALASQLREAKLAIGGGHLIAPGSRLTLGSHPPHVSVNVLLRSVLHPVVIHSGRQED